MKRISPLLYEWSRYDARTQRDANGHFVLPAAGESGVLVDPPPFNEGDEAHVRSLGGVAAVVLTTGRHLRDAARGGQVFGCPVLVPAADLPAVVETGHSTAQGYPAEGDLPCGLSATPVPHGPSPGETALYSPVDGGTVIVGDAVVGDPLGRLSLPQPANPAEAAGVARGLRALLARRLNRLLVAHGQSVLQGPVPLLQDLIYAHDPHAFLIRAGECHWGPARLFGRRFGSRAAEYTRLLGLKAIDFELTELPPGRQSFPLHRHDAEEELFIIAEGQGEVRTERDGTTQRVPIGAGDVLAFPPRFQLAHAIVNTGHAPLRYFAFSAHAEAVEMADYPTSGARMERTPYGKYRRFPLPERLDMPYFEGEPIDEAVE
ncbi:MAG TPA: cupin domain-containing protein [Chloroflexota bacterium]|nr:cupin domain-containing protein [Chloroflexota bacterium]